VVFTCVNIFKCEFSSIKQTSSRTRSKPPYSLNPYKHQLRGNHPFCTSAARKIGGWVDGRWGRSPKAFLRVILTKFFNGALRGIPVEGVAGKHQNGGWNKGKAFPSIIMNITTQPQYINVPTLYFNILNQHFIYR